MTLATPPASTSKGKSAAVTAEEMAVARRLSGGVGWPTVLLTLALLSVQVGMIVLWAMGIVPMAVGFVVNSFVVYAWYTVHHDATHKAISGRRARRRWLDVVCGKIAAFPLQLDFNSYAASHLRHHAHTNTSADPDLAVAGPMWQLPIKWAAANLLMIIGALPGGERVVARLLARAGIELPGPDSGTDSRKNLRRYAQVGLVLLLVTIPLGAFWPAFFLWWLPSRVGVFFLMLFFQWLPHFPFDRTDRFGATRINRFPGSTWLLLQQDRHLIHHLYPTLPWYRYRAAFRDLRPLLEANHAIIQGTGTSPHVPIQLREQSAEAA